MSREGQAQVRGSVRRSSKRRHEVVTVVEAKNCSEGQPGNEQNRDCCPVKQSMQLSQPLHPGNVEARHRTARLNMVFRYIAPQTANVFTKATNLITETVPVISISSSGSTV